MYHANVFQLIKSEDLPVYVYSPIVEPNPVNKPQFHQILGSLAKKIMYDERKPVVSVDGFIESLPEQISNLDQHLVKIPNVGSFEVKLGQVSNSTVGLDQFDNYKLLVNRLADIALTVLSAEYYKFHPKAPFILRDEPYFDKDLIEKTGIMDSKRYYRGLMKLEGKPVFVLNRETQLRSNKNLLVELKSLAKRFEEMNDTKIDFYNPPSEFVSQVNYLLQGKAADIAHASYPAPGIRKITGITWKYRAGDKIPGLEGSPIDYIKNTYGISGLDEKQPLVMYEIENLQRQQYHVPEVLSVGHTFEDLRKRIPSWQRSQIWGSIHPDCKNQLHKTYDVLYEIDKTLRDALPAVYPKLLEISTEPMDVSSIVTQPTELKLIFANKEVSIKPPYDTEFYRGYSEKKIAFAKPLPNVNALVCLEKTSFKIEKFLAALADEFKLRNKSELTFGFGSLDHTKNCYDGYSLVITIGIENATAETDDEIHDRFKKFVQNQLGIAHQHVTIDKANEDSVMQIIMQICLKLGGDPWLLPKLTESLVIIGVNSYLNPTSMKSEILLIVIDNEGHLLEQFEPIELKFKPDSLIELLIKLNQKYNRVLFLTSYDRFGLLAPLLDSLKKTKELIEYCIVEITENESLRFFESWVPKKAPRFGKVKVDSISCPIEAYESAPQGAILRSEENSFYLLTGRTIERESLKRGCPLPIRMEILEAKGEKWNRPEIAKSVLALCMMGRASGHMTSFPMPLYYLQEYAYYHQKYGAPIDARIKQRIFYI
jgi:hypothetical protein